VVRVFDVSLAELLADGVHRSEWWPRDGHETEREVHFFELEGETVWGYTARLLVRLLAEIVGVPVPAHVLD